MKSMKTHWEKWNEEEMNNWIARKEVEQDRPSKQSVESVQDHEYKGIAFNLPKDWKNKDSKEKNAHFLKWRRKVAEGHWAWEDLDGIASDVNRWIVQEGCVLGDPNESFSSNGLEWWLELIVKIHQRQINGEGFDFEKAWNPLKSWIIQGQEWSKWNVNKEKKEEELIIFFNSQTRHWPWKSWSQWENVCLEFLSITCNVLKKKSLVLEKKSMEKSEEVGLTVMFDEKKRQLWKKRHPFSKKMLDLWLLNEGLCQETKQASVDLRISFMQHNEEIIDLIKDQKDDLSESHWNAILWGALMSDRRDILREVLKLGWIPKDWNWSVDNEWLVSNIKKKDLGRLLGKPYLSSDSDNEKFKKFLNHPQGMGIHMLHMAYLFAPTCFEELKNIPSCIQSAQMHEVNPLLLILEKQNEKVNWSKILNMSEHFKMPSKPNAAHARAAFEDNWGSLTGWALVFQQKPEWMLQGDEVGETPMALLRKNCPNLEEKIQNWEKKMTLVEKRMLTKQMQKPEKTSKSTEIKIKRL